MSSGDARRRQRVSRACDECHRRKIKCDQQKPCSNCRTYNYECTYGQPFKRLLHSPEKYIQFLEFRLKYLKKMTEQVIPDVKLPAFLNIPNENFDYGPESVHTEKETSPTQGPSHEEIDSVFDRYGQLSLRDNGNADYRGSSSGFVFMQNIHKNIARASSSSSSSGQGQKHSTPCSDPSTLPYLPPTPAVDDGKDVIPQIQFPSYEEARSVTGNFFLSDHFLVHLHHIPTFYERLHTYYYSEKKDPTFHFLLAATLCLGYTYLSSPSNAFVYPYHKAYKYYYYIRSAFHFEESYDIEVIQVLISIALFALFSSRLSQAYSFMNIALFCCHELGLHRDFSDVLTSPETRLRKRVFYSVYIMSCYASTIIGLPLNIEDDEIDQGLPNSYDFVLDNEAIPANVVASECGSLEIFNQHISLSRILSHFVRKVYPIKSSNDTNCRVSLTAVRENENRLTNWWKNLASYLKVDEVPEFSPKWIQAISLELKFRQIELIFYRPFVHNITDPLEESTAKPTKPSSFALKCVQSAERIVELLKKLSRSPSMPKMFFNLYAGYYALMTLVYSASLTRETTARSNAFIEKAREGYSMLAGIYQGSAYFSTILDAVRNMLLAYDMNLSRTDYPHHPSQNLIPNQLPKGKANIPQDMPMPAPLGVPQIGGNIPFSAYSLVNGEPFFYPSYPSYPNYPSYAGAPLPTQGNYPLLPQSGYYDPNALNPEKNYGKYPSYNSMPYSAPYTGNTIPHTYPSYPMYPYPIPPYYSQPQPSTLSDPNTMPSGNAPLNYGMPSGPVPPITYSSYFTGADQSGKRSLDALNMRQSKR
ncbi:DNA-binding transcription factor, zf-fungal binuclear cluster type [Schizosaccharomyces osmophilus]|uniref:DNA-binding transcription factor, zf-fungal binuclear cluster type n=1 Tax=Schizosaccharomyces osmophilus TaxID=2545709 RepID=A0AAE9WDX4_9SCHI|nr:DNA-binding transcription factor, zf-fungal binuclear cluster type [Schizosaccharomyces osmophilus]WBW74474.1 DNA-binding transcription factor, zf-fungal binuclear cluster type [Schizosaccharomyces osmophilus]